MIRIMAIDSLKLGLRNAFAQLRAESIMWSPSIKPAFDAFVEFKADIVVGYTSDINNNRALRKCLLQHPNIRGIFFNDLSRPIKSEYILPNMTICDMPILVDHHMFFPVPKDDTWACDLSFVYTTPQHKDDDLIIPLCENIGEYNIRLYGEQVSLCPQWCGQISEELKKVLFCSSKLNIITPHTDPELIQQICGCQGNMVYLTKNVDVKHSVNEAMDNLAITPSHNTEYITYTTHIINLMNKLGYEETINSI